MNPERVTTCPPQLSSRKRSIQNVFGFSGTAGGDQDISFIGKHFYRFPKNILISVIVADACQKSRIICSDIDRYPKLVAVF